VKDVQQILELCKQHNVRMIDFKMIDIDGRWRHLTIPTERFSQETVEQGIGFDGSNYGYATVEKSDMVFLPNMDTAHIDPFAATPTLSMSGDVYVIDTPHNRPFDQYPRNVALRAERFMTEQGIADEVILGPEFEFYILDNMSCEVSPQRVASSIDASQAVWNTGKEDCLNRGYKVPHHGGYHITMPQDVAYDLRSHICLMLEKWDVPVKYHHPEVGGPGQNEIEVELGPLTQMADRTMIVKYLVKNACLAAHKTATFMPKPIWGEAGNGLHVHIMMFKNGESLFCDDAGYSGLSQTAHWFIGGLLNHIASLCALTNPSTNSFKRLVPGFEAPVTIGYATANRSAVIRIPAYAKLPSRRRFELRNPDATCNPYYAYAAILMAGLDGIQKKTDPSACGWGPFDFNLFDLSDADKAKIKSIPRSLGEALDALEGDHDYLLQGGVFPESFINTWLKRKRQELVEFNKIPHPAEFLHYFDL